MDPKYNQTPGLGFSQPSPSAGQGPMPSAANATAGNQQRPAMPTAQVAEEDNSDVQEDQVWVDKVKDVADRTKHDPFLQSNELNKLKAEYLKVRFNKQVKVEDQK